MLFHFVKLASDTIRYFQGTPLLSPFCHCVGFSSKKHLFSDGAGCVTYYQRKTGNQTKIVWDQLYFGLTYEYTQNRIPAI